MTQDEIPTRAREAHIKTYDLDAVEVAAVRACQYDDCSSIQAAIQALTDAHRPLSEIVPPDPDMIAAGEWAREKYHISPGVFLSGAWDNSDAIQGFLAGCRHARGGGA